MTPTTNDTCSLRDPGKPEAAKCGERSSIFRTDGLCPYHGKCKDGLCTSSPLGTKPGLRGGMTANAARQESRRRWAGFLDGEIHEVPGDPDVFRRNANQAARTRQLRIQVWTDNGKTYEAVAS